MTRSFAAWFIMSAIEVAAGLIIGNFLAGKLATQIYQLANHIRLP